MTFLIKTAKAIEEAFRNLEKVLIWISTFILLVLMFLASGDVIGRYIFNSPIFGAMEIQKILLGAIVFLGWAHTQSKNGHISVDILFLKYPPFVQKIVRFITLVLSLFLFAIITRQAVIVTFSEWRSGELIQLLHIPSAPFKLTLIFGAILICIEIILQLCHLFPEMFRRRY